MTGGMQRRSLHVTERDGQEEHWITQERKAGTRRSHALDWRRKVIVPAVEWWVTAASAVARVGFRETRFRKS